MKFKKIFGLLSLRRFPENCEDIKMKGFTKLMTLAVFLVYFIGVFDEVNAACCNKRFGLRYKSNFAVK